MLWGAHHGKLELRNEGGEIRLRAVFPYGRETVLVAGGRSGPARREVIAARAFGARIASGEDIHFLAAHDFNKPLASRSAGTLNLTDSDYALTMEAVIAPELRVISYVGDFLAAHHAGLITGLSPGFRIADVPEAETIELTDDAIVRTVRAADLFELSAVTKPAYPAAQIDARNWEAVLPDGSTVNFHHLRRWRR